MMLRMAGGHPEKAAAAMLALCCFCALMTPSAGFTMPSSVQGLRRIHPSLHPSLRERKCGGVATPRGVVSGLRMADNPVNRLPEYSVDKVSCYKDGILEIRANHRRILPHLEHIRKQEFFRLFAVDLLSSCTYMPTADMPCEMDKCEIECSDNVPDKMRVRDTQEHDFRLDGWVRWDMPGDFTDYYDLAQESERWTEYDGRKVWKFIHERICFAEGMDLAENAWKRDFNRAVSGMHSSVSAHILEDMMKQNGWDESSDEAFAEYKRRISDVPEAVANLHFAYMIILCAIQEAAPRLSNCSYMGTGDKVLPSMLALISDPLLTHPDIQKAAESMRRHATSSSAMVWKARLRTRDLLGVMNCVQCNLCRLHGKVVCLGLAVGLQILLGSEGSGGTNTVPLLHRVEVAGLLTTAAKFAHAVEVVNKFERRRLGSLTSDVPAAPQPPA